MEFEIIKEAVDVPKVDANNGGSKPRHPVTLAIIGWLETEDKTLKIKCKSSQEATKAYSLASGYRKNHKKDYTIYKRGVEVYLIKA